MKIKDAVILWSIESPIAFRLIPRSEDVDLNISVDGVRLNRSSGGVWCFVSDLDEAETQAWLGGELLTILVRDGIDPKVMHKEMMRCDEYRSMIPLDAHHPQRWSVIDCLFAKQQ